MKKKKKKKNRNRSIKLRKVSGFPFWKGGILRGF
jgi:hypothetical protein